MAKEIAMRNPDNTHTPQALFPGLLPAVDPAAPGRPVVIAGPCSAESCGQVLDTARQLKDIGVDVFRAGVWKPRTHPGCFEGCGAKALEWLAEVRKCESGSLADGAGYFPVSTEVASPEHLRQALDAGIDILWLGARTTTNPFAVQAIADAAVEWCRERGVRLDSLRFLVKNPATQDLELWIGAIQRLYNAGVRRITAIHRGFSVYGDSFYRNSPQWQIPMELRRRVGRSLQLLCDPSHIGGRRDLVEPIARQALERGFDGLIIEVHPLPDTALSDSAQQITPAQLREILSSLQIPHESDGDRHLEELRRQIDSIDDELMGVLARRMAISREIGQLKQMHSLSVVQPDRYRELIERRVSEASAIGVSPDFIRELLSVIHEESVRQQLH